MTDPAARAERGVPVLIGADEMARIDEAAQKLGLAEDALMEAAGAAVAEVVHAELARLADAAIRNEPSKQVAAAGHQNKKRRGDNPAACNLTIR